MMATSTEQHAWSRRLLTYGTALGLFALLSSSLLGTPQTSVPALAGVMVAFFLWLGVELFLGWRHYQRLEAGIEVSPVVWNGLGLVLLAGMAILLRLSGGLQSPFYPLLYLSLAFLTSYGTGGQGILWFVYTLMLEMASLVSVGVPQSALGTVGLHILFLTGFAGSHHLFLGGMLRGIRESRRHISYPPPPLENLTSIQEEPISDSESPEQLTAYSMKAMQPDQKMLLSLLKEGLDAHTCAFLWMSRDGSNYIVQSYESEELSLDVGPISSKEGALAGLFKTRSKLRSYYHARPLDLPYYGREVQLRSLLAVPVFQGGELRGALVADRLQDKAFTPQEEVLLEAAAIILGSAIESERSLWSSPSSDPLLQSSNSEPFWLQLNDFHSPATFARQILNAAHQMVPFDFGFVSLCDSTAFSHTVLVGTEQWRDLEGESFEVGQSVLSLAFNYGCPLPRGGRLHTKDPYISNIDPPELEDVQSLFLVPLKAQGHIVGALVLGSKESRCFENGPDSSVWMMFGHYVAALMHNIQMRQEMQRSRSLDGLTRLDSHRSFLDKLEEKFESVQRYQRKLSLLLLDIDGFGEINRTYGTRVGDRVLEQLANRLRQTSHDVDLIARFGGDEFVLLIDNTSSSQALKLADRLRHEMTQLAFLPREEEPTCVFSVTLSIGIATYPDHALTPCLLVENSREALQRARQQGGNNVYLFSSSVEGESLPQQPSLEERLLAAPPRRGWGWGSLPPSSQHDSDPFRTAWPHSASHLSSDGPSLRTPRPPVDSRLREEPMEELYPELSFDKDLLD